MGTTLRRSLGALEYFTFGFGSMVGAGWLVVMDDWLRRGGPGGAMLGFLAGAVLLLPIAHTYGRLVRMIPDAGAEIAYTERVFPSFVSFTSGWMMVLAYAIVCPWEAVAIGNLLARLFPAMNALTLYTVAGKAITLPRLVAGLGLTAAIGIVNFRGIRLSGRFQDITTIGLLACFALFVALGFGRGSATNVEPLFAPVGPFVSVLLVAQIVPYFMTGFESIPKASEEALPGLRPGTLSRAITAALLAVDRAVDSRRGRTVAVQSVQRKLRRRHATGVRAGPAGPPPSRARRRESNLRDSRLGDRTHRRPHGRGRVPRRRGACSDQRSGRGSRSNRVVRGLSCLRRAGAPRRHPGRRHDRRGRRNRERRDYRNEIGACRAW
ncbi:MAG: hypothetical protein AUI09_05230 [Gemmatimonadetes bacterium 13_2_20CM_2_66_5]|nr:MAG: hypothetical protein AUI09_05230 [Gemmatimonadetes bacterium 13_2_20CM_2_66_5]